MLAFKKINFYQEEGFSNFSLYIGLMLNKKLMIVTFSSFTFKQFNSLIYFVIILTLRLPGLKSIHAVSKLLPILENVVRHEARRHRLPCRRAVQKARLLALEVGGLLALPLTGVRFTCRAWLLRFVGEAYCRGGGWGSSIGSNALTYERVGRRCRLRG